VVDVSSVGAHVNFLRLVRHDGFIRQSSPDLEHVVFVVVCRRVASRADRARPLWIFGAQVVLINITFHVIYHLVDSCTDLVRGMAFEVVLVARVVQLAVSNRTESD